MIALVTGCTDLKLHVGPDEGGTFWVDMHDIKSTASNSTSNGSTWAHCFTFRPSFLYHGHESTPIQPCHM